MQIVGQKYQCRLVYLNVPSANCIFCILSVSDVYKNYKLRYAILLHHLPSEGLI